MTAVKRGGIPTPVGVGKEKVEERIDLKGEQVSQKEKLTFSERKELGVPRVDCQVRVRQSGLPVLGNGNTDQISGNGVSASEERGCRGRREAACSVCLLCPGKEGGSAQELCSLPLRLSGSAGSTRVMLRVVTPVEESAVPGERRAMVVLKA